ncbi:MAG: sulfotransferase [Paraglaciecola sp.]|uniref:sulfotransferase family protein n=1 Tax=Paraglaciecola sp. TaxID=1920173 RepID=UPI0032659382
MNDLKKPLDAAQHPIFIMGTQRSGTTLLTRMLSAHAHIFVQNELPLIKVFVGDRSKSTIIKKISEIIKRKHGSSVHELVSDKGIKCWGLKDPQLTEYIEELKAFLPGSKFIIIVRDGRGVANSYIENKWGLGTNAYTGALRWKEEVQQQKAFMKLAPENFMLIRFEDLVTDMPNNLKKVCKFLNIEYSDTMLNYHKSDAAYVANKENINTQKKPDVQLANKWQQRLTKKQIDIIEYAAGDELNANNYTLQGQNITLSPIAMFYYRLHQKIVGEWQLQFQLKRAKIKGKIKQWRK